MNSFASRMRAGLAASAVVLSMAAHAEPSPSGGAPLDSVVVTATRTATQLDDVLESVTVLSREDIETRQVLSLQDLFAGEAGLQTSNNGGLGKVSSVFLRGANADQVLVLIDGVRVGSATIGTTTFEYLPVDRIERVEIVRGPLSSLYGSEAMGGVIQIFTHKPTADGTSIDADAAVGSHDTSTLGANLSTVSGPVSYALSASNLTSNGYRNCTGAAPSAALPYGAGCEADDPAADGYHNVSASARFGYRFSATADADAMILRASGGTRYAGAFTNHEDFVEQVAALAAHWAPSSALRLTAQLGQSRDDERDSFNFIESPGNLFDTLRSSASLQADWQAATNQLVTFGSDYVRDRIASDTVFPVTSRVITGTFGEYQSAWGAQQLKLSARRDDNSQFGGETTGRAAWGYRFAGGLRLTASFGTAFHAPSFDDLYYPQFGNAALRPEQAHSLDLGLERRLTHSSWSLHAFESQVHDLISFDAIQNAPENTDRARIRGLEMQSGLTVGEWTAGLTGSFLDARNRTPGSANFDTRLPRRARATGRLEIARQWTGVRCALRFNAAGPSWDDLANTQPVGGYSTADALLEWAPARQWTMQAKVANAADRRYQTALYYPQDRRSFLVTVRFRSGGP